jgi:hypothetical protein
MAKTSKRFIADWRKIKSLFITHFIPNWEDPGWGHFGELALADSVKQLSKVVADKKLSVKVLELSKKMAKEASGGMINGWEDGDDICPPWWPFPFPPVPGPGPFPWKEIVSAEQVQIANILTQISGLTTSKEFNLALKSVATELVRGVVNKLADDFERCGTVPRPKIR